MNKKPKYKIKCSNLNCQNIMELKDWQYKMHLDSKLGKCCSRHCSRVVQSIKGYNHFTDVEKNPSSKNKETYPDLVGLLSYADTEQHDGTLYKSTNWTMGDISKGTPYYLTKNGEKINWRRVRKHRKSLGKTEAEYIEKMKLLKVDSSDKIKFKYTY